MFLDFQECNLFIFYANIKVTLEEVVKNDMLIKEVIERMILGKKTKWQRRIHMNDFKWSIEDS